MTSEETIEEKLKNLAHSISPDETLIENVMSRIDAKTAADSSVSPAQNIWRAIMKSPITKIAAAAVIIIACVVGISLWRTTGSGIALADVLARFEQVKAFRFKGGVTINPGKPDGVEFRGRSVFSREYGYKSNIEVRTPNGGWAPLAERYYYPQKRTIIQIGHPIKTYSRWELNDAEAQWNQEFFNQHIDPGSRLRDIMACKYENLGRSIIDGVEAERFHTTDPNCPSSFGRSIFKDPRSVFKGSQIEIDLKIWIDVKTRLPIRYEERSSGLDEMGNPLLMEIFGADFEWDVPVTAAEFDPPPVPDGYTVVNKHPEPDYTTTGVEDEESNEPVNDLLKFHSVWEGTCDETGRKPYPMILFIQNRRGNEFEATTWYPTLGNGLVKASGQVNPDGLVTFTEDQVINGKWSVMSGAQFTATIEGKNLKGSYVIKLPFGKVDKGNFSLRLAD
jgi:hypothetical protein